ncbi:hypothetical protein HPB49_022108 [Dermacentor silvarum]|uniref:Uncharacterized protein n=1 Tax=Dermacentor silvarum TaxID=543639 RepID=A0ACB8DKZ8_DERSI|nr:hypothetical protein HPB49_022108 [Dermacentor silvarum]
MKGKEQENTDATGSEVYSGSSKRKQAAKKSRKTSSKTRSKSPSRATSRLRRHSVDRASPKMSKKKPSASPIGSLKPLTPSRTEGAPITSKEPAEIIEGESVSAAVPAKEGNQQIEAAIRSTLDNQYEPPDERLKSLEVIKDVIVSPLSPINSPSHFSESIPWCTWKDEPEALASTPNASSRAFWSGTAIMSDAVSTCQSPPRPNAPTDKCHLSAVQMNGTEPLNTLRARGRVSKTPERATILRLPRQTGPLDAAANIRKSLGASDTTLANTAGDKGEQQCTTLPTDVKATRLSKSIAGTSMSYRPMTYRGSMRMVRSGGDAEFLSIAVAIDVLFVMLVILVGLHFAVVGRVKKSNKTQEGYAFCCREEATELATVIDTAVNPCNNLYEYVCRNVHRMELTDAKFMGWFERSIFDGTVLSRSTAGELLLSYYKFCNDAMRASNLTQLAADVAGSLLDSGVVKANMTSGSMVGTFFSTVLVNGGFFIVKIKIVQQLLVQTLTVELADPENLVACDHCEGIMKVINERLNTKFTREDVQSFQSVAVPKKLCSASTGDVQLLNHLFHTVKPSVIVMILNSSLLVNPSVLSRMVVTVNCFDEISYLVSTLAAASHQPLSSAFLVADASARLANQLFVAIPGKVKKTSFCKTQVKTLRNLWNKYLVDHVATADKNIVMINLYESTKAAVLKSFIEQKIFDQQAGEQRDAIDIIDSMLVVLPRDSLPSGLRMPSPPTIAANFPAHYYTMQRYEFLANRARLVQDLPDSFANLTTAPTRRGHNLYVHPGYYLSLRQASKWLPLIHFPKLGAALAAFMWHAVLYERDWSPNTTSKIRGFTKCFGSKYLGKVRLEESEEMIAASALALGSMKRASREDDLSYIPVEVTEGLFLSHAQLFYLNWALSNCLYDGSAGKDVAVNIPATYTGDFRLAFGCSAGSYMAYGNWCPL